MADTDRRKHDRVPKEVLLRYRCVAPEDIREEASTVGVLIEISRSGLQIMTKHEYPKNALLEVHLPDTDITTEQTRHAQVVNCRKASEPGRFHIGCRFVRVGDE